jgi:hypothetical protein
MVSFSFTFMDAGPPFSNVLYGYRPEHPGRGDNDLSDLAFIAALRYPGHADLYTGPSLTAVAAAALFRAATNGRFRLFRHVDTKVFLELSDHFCHYFAPSFF